MVARYETVVIVEDEPETADMFAEMLHLIGYQAYKSYGGIRAIDLIAEKKPCAILLDIMMPDLSGFEVLKCLRRDPCLTLIPVIIVSAKGFPSDIEKGLMAGAASYLTKPVSISDLKRAIENATHSS